MRTDAEISGVKAVLEVLGMIWRPAEEAAKLQQHLNVRSLEDTCAAAERAGYEICYVDLPAKVSGLAVVIAGKPHIVVNRAKSRQHRQYTVPHELGHHVLHVNASRDPDQPALLSEGLVEFQAHMFAAAWVICAANENEREDVMRQNPESSAILFASLLMTVGIIVIPLVAHLLSRLFGNRPSASVGKK